MNSRAAAYFYHEDRVWELFQEVEREARAAHPDREIEVDRVGYVIEVWDVTDGFPGVLIDEVEYDADPTFDARVALWS